MKDSRLTWVFLLCVTLLTLPGWTVERSKSRHDPSKHSSSKNDSHIHCFACTYIVGTNDRKNCKKPAQKNMTKTKVCTAPKNWCSKVVTFKHTVRDCGVKPDNRKDLDEVCIEKNDKSTYLCRKSLCNSSPLISPPVLLISSSLLLHQFKVH